jgi:7-cyano-7-deazaguanine synthase in queuosine biosynthesis
MADPRYSGLVPECSKSFAEKVCRAGWPEGMEPDLERPTAVTGWMTNDVAIDSAQLIREAVFAQCHECYGGLIYGPCRDCDNLKPGSVIYHTLHAIGLDGLAAEFQ